MTEHVHEYRAMATRLPDGRIGFEYFATARPIYGFKCWCGDLKEATLEEAAENGWVRVLEL